MGSSPQGCLESDTIEQPALALSRWWSSPAAAGDVGFKAVEGLTH